MMKTLRNRMRFLISVMSTMVLMSVWAAMPMPIAQWTTLAANSKGGAEGTLGANFTMTAGTGGSFDRGVGKTAKSSTTANEGIKISWGENAYTGRALSILIKYSGYDCAGLGNNSFIATTWGSNEEVVYANANGSNVGLSANVTSNNGGTQNLTSPTYAMPTAGYVLVSMNRDDGDNTGTRLSFAPAASYPTFTSVAYQSGHKYSTENFSAIKIGGTVSSSGTFHRPGMTIEEVRLYNQVVTPEMLTSALEELPSVPVLLANFKTNTSADAEGWYNYTQEGGASIDNVPSATTSPRFKLTCSGGNIKGSFAVCSTDTIEEGTYVDINGGEHASLAEEIATSLGLTGSIPDVVIKSGMAHGARATGTATISGLTTGEKYVVYVGIAAKSSNGTDKASGIKVEASGFTSVDSLEYVVTQAGTNTTVDNRYQTFAAGNNINAAPDGIMVVRMKGVKPAADGTIVYKHNMGNGTDGEGLVSISFVAVAQMNADKFTATIGADTDFSAIQWDGGATWKNGAKAILTATADCTIAMGNASPGYIEVNGAGKTVTIKCTSDNLPTVRGTATIKYLFDATEAPIELSASTLASIRLSGSTYTFEGTAENGVTLNYGVSVGAEMKSHLIFASGKHRMSYGNANSQLFATGHSNADPTILINNGAVLDFTAKDISGWSGGANGGAVIRVNKGGTLNFIQSASTTFFYRQRLLLEPGSLMTFDYDRDTSANEGRFRLHGGTAKDTAQIYVPDYEQDKTSDPAIIRQVGDSELVLASDDTRGLAIYVGSNAKLRMEAPVRVKLSNNDAALAKYGEGELELVKGGTLHTLNVAEGKITLDESTDQVTINNACMGMGTLVFTKSEVSLGQSYREPKLVFAENATVKVTAKGEEKADGAVVLNTAMTTIEGLTFVVDENEVDADDIVLDSTAGTITLKLATQTVKTTSNVSEWNSSWTGVASVKNDDPENAITLTIDAAFPTDVTTVNVFGNVNIVYADGASSDSTVTIVPQSDSVVSVSGIIANPITVQTGVTLTTTGATTSAGKIANSGTVEVTDGTLTLSAGSLGGTITIRKGATIKFTEDNAIANTVVLNVYGTLDLTEATWYDSNSDGRNVLNLYAGSKIIGGNCGMVMTGGFSNTINIKQYAEADVNYVLFDVKYHTSSYGAAYSTTFAIENDNSKPKVGLKITKPFQRNGTVIVSGTHIQGLELDCAKAVKLANNNRCLHGEVTIKSGTTLVLQGGDMIPYSTSNDFALNLYGTLDCGSFRQTLSAEGGNNVINLFDGARITGTGSANGGYTSILDIFQNQVFTVSGTATIDGPVGLRNATKLQVAPAEGATTAKLVLTQDLLGNANAKIDLQPGAQVQLPSSVDASKVVTTARGWMIASKSAAEEGQTVYRTVPKFFTISIR